MSSFSYPVNWTNTTVGDIHEVRICGRSTTRPDV